MLVVRADDVAEKSPSRGREAGVPCSRPYFGRHRDGRREPSRVISRIQQGIARPKRVKDIRVAPQGDTGTVLDRVDSGGPP